jgi:hypothetical protein
VLPATPNLPEEGLRCQQVLLCVCMHTRCLACAVVRGSRRPGGAAAPQLAAGRGSEALRSAGAPTGPKTGTPNAPCEEEMLTGCCVDDVDRWLMAMRCSKSTITKHPQCSGQRKATPPMLWAARASEQGDAGQGGGEIASAMPQPQEARPQQHKRSCLRQVQTEEGKREARRLSSRRPRSSSPHH